MSFLYAQYFLKTVNVILGAKMSGENVKIDNI